MTPGTRAALFSSATDQWATPRDLAARLVAEYGIETDVCADASNAVVPRFYTREQDGLTQPWTGVCFCNPPYGRDIGKWVSKARDAASKGATVVCLLPARTDTRWWHNYVEPRDTQVQVEARFIKGRLKFGAAKNSAPFPSVVVVFRPQVAVLTWTLPAASPGAGGAK